MLHARLMDSRACKMLRRRLPCTCTMHANHVASRESFPPVRLSRFKELAEHRRLPPADTSVRNWEHVATTAASCYNV